MRTDFENQLESCAENGLSVPPLPVAKGNSSPLVPRPIHAESAPARAIEHITQATFLKALIAIEDSETSLQLRDSLAKAERESRCIRRALFLTVMVFILSLAGLSYGAVLQPRFFANPTGFVTKSLSILGLASLISQLELFGYLLWHRFAVNRLCNECRHRALLLVESRLKASRHRSLSVDSGLESGPASAGASDDQTGSHRRNQRYENATPASGAGHR